MKKTYLFRTLWSWIIPWPIQIRFIRNKMASGTVIYQDPEYSVVLHKRAEGE